MISGRERVVSAIPLYILIIAIGKITQVRPYPNEMKTVYETHRVLEAQNREMARLLTQMQRNPALLANPDQPPVELGPGQVMTPEGFVIDGTAFDTLEDELLPDTDGGWPSLALDPEADKYIQEFEENWNEEVN